MVYALVADMGTYVPLGWAVAKQVYDDNKIYAFNFVIHAGIVYSLFTQKPHTKRTVSRMAGVDLCDFVSRCKSIDRSAASGKN